MIQLDPGPDMTIEQPNTLVGVYMHVCCPTAHGTHESQLWISGGGLNLSRPRFVPSCASRNTISGSSDSVQIGEKLGCIKLWLRRETQENCLCDIPTFNQRRNCGVCHVWERDHFHVLHQAGGFFSHIKYLYSINV